MAAALDESHSLAQRLGDAERTAEHWHARTLHTEGVAAGWHDEFEAAQAKLAEVYDSLSWRLTRPLRAAKRLLGRGE